MQLPRAANIITSIIQVFQKLPMGNLAAYIFLCLVQSLYDYVPEKEYLANKNIFNSKLFI